MRRQANKMMAIRRLIADDGHAMTFQSLGQYRSALLKAVDEMVGPACRYCGVGSDGDGGLVKRGGAWVCDDCDRADDDSGLDVEGWEERKRQQLAEQQEY